MEGQISQAGRRQRLCGRSGSPSRPPRTGRLGDPAAPVWPATVPTA